MQVFDKAKDKMKTEVLDKLAELAVKGMKDFEEAEEPVTLRLIRKIDEEEIMLQGGGDGLGSGLGEKVDGGGKAGAAGKGGKRGEKIMEDYEVDDNFNLPPIIALVLGVAYIFLGALLFKLWEDWSYLEAFYFTFVSLSTIGFGDVIPNHPKFFLASFIYLLSGLSLIAMVINVVMDAVSNTIVKAASVFNFRKKNLNEARNILIHNSLKRRMSV